MKTGFFNLAAIVGVFIILCCGSAHAQLVIVPTFDSSITSGSNAATIEATIDQAIDVLESHISNPITVTIDFTGTNAGLGESNTYYSTISYSTYLNDLETKQTLSANDITAIASLPSGSNNPVNGTSSVEMTLPLLRALGINIAAPGGEDSTISLNLGIMNLTRSGTQTVGKYDLMSVVTHEMDEVLGTGGAGSQLGSGSLTGPVGPLDLFRYSGSGTRSYVTGTNVVSYFSINGGITDLVHFNQAGGGSDYADWGDGVSPADGQPNNPPQVQDAFGGPYQSVSVPNEPNLGTNELIALDVVGYNLVPEPSAMALLVVWGLVVFGLWRWRRRRPADQAG